MPPTKYLIKTKRLRLVVGEASASSGSYYSMKRRKNIPKKRKKDDGRPFLA